MTYVVCEPCIGTKDTACVDACPVDCIHPTKDEAEFEEAELLYIDPGECIDCGAMLVDELPVAETDESAAGDSHFVPFRTYSTHVHAQLVREALANEGISAVIKGSEVYGAGSGSSLSSGAVIWIPDDEQEEAARIADSILDPI